MTVFGFHLGEKLSVPECAYIKKYTMYAENDSSPCFERFYDALETKQRTTPIANETIEILFPFDQSPSMVSGRRIVGQVVDGNLEAVGITTMGLQAQDQTLSDLKKKYGEPSRTVEEQKGNSFGAVFSSHLALWTFQNLTVTFQGMTDHVESGLVNIDTKKGSEYRAAILAKYKRGPKL